MPICIECRHPVRTLWTQYSGAGGPSSGHNIRLTVCKNCGRFCDKYVEHDFVVLFIDLVLIKPQVYRHLLHNTLMRDEDEDNNDGGGNGSSSNSSNNGNSDELHHHHDAHDSHDEGRGGTGRHKVAGGSRKGKFDRFDPSIVRLGTLLLLFDVYLTWARIEKHTGGRGGEGTGAGTGAVVAGGTGMGAQQIGLGSLATQPIVCQYLFFLILCSFSTLAFHLSIRFLASSPASPLCWSGLLHHHHNNNNNAAHNHNAHARPNSVSTALLVSSSTKLFPILMVVWDYDVPAAARSLGWAVVLNNVEALKILLDCGYPVALLLAAAGAVARWTVGRAILWMVGLDGVEAAAGEGGVAADGRALWAALLYVRDCASKLAVG